MIPELCAHGQQKRKCPQCELLAADERIAALEAELAEARKREEEARSQAARMAAALLDVARQCEALKQPCGMDPESPQAIRNGQYMSISLNARAALRKAGA